MRQASLSDNEQPIGVTSATVGAIVLAAGGSRRLGKPKQLLEYVGRSLIRHVAEVAVASRLNPVVVVLGAHADRCAQELVGLPVICANNADWPLGMGSSIRAGIRLLNRSVDAAVIMLCDQPRIDPATIGQIIEAHRTSGSAIVASEYMGTVGVPALFSSRHFDDLASLPDDSGAKSLIECAGNEVPTVPFPAGIFDIDTPSDYERLIGPVR